MSNGNTPVAVHVSQVTLPLIQGYYLGVLPLWGCFLVDSTPIEEVSQDPGPLLSHELQLL